MLNLHKFSQLVDQYGNPIVSPQNVDGLETDIETGTMEEWPIYKQPAKGWDRFWEWLENTADLWPTRAVKVTLQKQSLNLHIKKTAEVYTADLLWTMLKGVEGQVEQESVNWTARGSEAVVNFPTPDGRQQRYHITIEPLDVFMRDTVWGEEGPPGGMTNLPYANRLNLKKHADRLNLHTAFDNNLTLRKKTALDIGGMEFPDVTKETIDAFVDAQSYVADRLWYWLNERHNLPIFTADPDSYYVQEIDTDQVKFNMSNEEMLDMYHEAFNEWLKHDAPPEIKTDEQQQEILYNTVFTSLMEGYV